MSRAFVVLSVLLVVLGFSLPVSADTILFDFNDLAANINSTSNSDPIEVYMEGLYGSDITVNSGAKTLKERPENPYPPGLYLGNSDLAADRGEFAMPPGHVDPKDTYLINRWNSSSLPSNVRDRIVITFEEVPITSVEFDWEIFPVTTASADITVLADGDEIFFQALFGADKQLGDLGHFVYAFSEPVHELRFVDWTDAPIGIDNLQVTRVPEPSGLLLLGAGFIAWAARRRGRR